MRWCGSRSARSTPQLLFLAPRLGGDGHAHGGDRSGQARDSGSHGSRQARHPWWRKASVAVAPANVRIQHCVLCLCRYGPITVRYAHVPPRLATARRAPCRTGMAGLTPRCNYLACDQHLSKSLCFQENERQQLYPLLCFVGDKMKCVYSCSSKRCIEFLYFVVF